MSGSSKESWFIGALRRTNNFVRRDPPKECPTCGGPVGPDGRSTLIPRKREQTNDPPEKPGVK